MNIEQVKLAKLCIKEAFKRIAEIQAKLDNPRVRKVDMYKKAIESNREVIADCLLRLYESGEISYRGE